MTGYELFRAQGLAIKAKNGEVRQAPSTPVILPNYSIEEKVIEKKEGKNLFENYKINHLRVVDNTKYTAVNGELMLPKEVLNLVDNKMYLPRHNKLARDYGVKYLLKLAELASTKGKPSHWYAKATSKKNWQQTSDMLIKLFKKLDMTREKLAHLRVSEQWLNYFAGAFSKLSEKQIAYCLELASARGVKKPPNLIAKLVKMNLELAKPAK